MSNFDQTDQYSKPKSVKNKLFLEFFLTISWQESCLDLSCLVNFEKLKFLTCLEPKFLINWKSWIVLTAIWLSWSCLVLSFKILSLSWIVLSWEIPVLTHPWKQSSARSPKRRRPNLVEGEATTSPLTAEGTQICRGALAPLSQSFPYKNACARQLKRGGWLVLVVGEASRDSK